MRWTGDPFAYGYDALGRRVEKTVAGKTMRFCCAGGRALEADYVYGTYIDEVLEMRRDVDADGTMDPFYYHLDDQYNVLALVDPFGNVAERYTYGGLPAAARFFPLL